MTNDILEKIRSFNRFYTSVIGVINNQILQSNYSLTEARLIYEVHRLPGITARQLKEIVSVDEGYLSRVIAKFVKQKILIKKQSVEDKRVFSLKLSEKGTQIYLELNQRSNEDVKNLIQNLSSAEQKELVKLLGNVKTLLTKK